MPDAMLDRIAQAKTLQELDAVRVALLGKQGEITAKLKTLGAMDPDARAAEAPKVHALREAVTQAIVDRTSALETAERDRRLTTEMRDLSLRAAQAAAGS